jgi:16S rRNA (guanine527-N7)-methyltransferase
MPITTPEDRDVLISTLKEHRALFGVAIGDSEISRLAEFHAFLSEHNDILHLTAPMSPEEFVTRHILESLTLLKHLPHGARFIDVGPGGGLPSIPCLIARSDLSATLVESSAKKSSFLEKCIKALGLTGQAKIVARQFEETPPPTAEFVTSRALDKFTKKIPALLRWSVGKSKLFFGGPSLAEALAKEDVAFESELMPLSEQRYLFICGTEKIREE